MSAQSQQQQQHSSLTKPTLLHRVFNFACPNAKRAVELNFVDSNFEDTLQNYSTNLWKRLVCRPVSELHATEEDDDTSSSEDDNEYSSGFPGQGIVNNNNKNTSTRLKNIFASTKKKKQQQQQIQKQKKKTYSLAQEKIFAERILHTICATRISVLISPVINTGMVDVNESDLMGNTPLIVASSTCYLPAILELVFHGADSTTCNTLGESPLHAICRCEQQYTAMVSSPTSTTTSTNEPLEAAKFFVEEMKVDVNAMSRNSMTPLCLAARSAGRLDLVEYLVNSAGATIFFSNRCTNPLFCAVERNHQNVVEFLIKKILEVFPSSSTKKLKEEKREQEYETTATSSSSLPSNNNNNNKEKTIFLQDSSSKSIKFTGENVINSYNERGQTCLFVAARDGHFEICKILVKEAKSVLNCSLENFSSVGCCQHSNSLLQQQQQQQLQEISQNYPSSFSKEQILEVEKKEENRKKALKTPLGIASSNLRLSVVKFLKNCVSKENLKSVIEMVEFQIPINKKNCFAPGKLEEVLQVLKE